MDPQAATEPGSMGRSKAEKRAYRGRGVSKSRNRGTQRRVANYREERDDSGREDYGRDDSGRDQYGHDNPGRENAGRNDFGRENSGRDAFGRDGFGHYDLRHDDPGRDQYGPDQHGRIRYGHDVGGRGGSGHDYSGRDTLRRDNSTRANRDHADPGQHEGHNTYYDDVQSELRHNRARHAHRGRGGRGGRQSRSHREPRPSHTQDNGGETLAQLRERHERLDKYIGYMKEHLEVHPTYAMREAAHLTSAMQGMGIRDGEKEQRYQESGTASTGLEDKSGKGIHTEPGNKKDIKRVAWASRQQRDYENREAKRREEAHSAGDEMEIE